ncbi:MAG TPA: Gar1/Naf1 family protein [Methanomassiliicoccales archaeon]|jgi:rRNA processing protein Gar1|nr:Gar1/Naf1 family protein [Euryarchaeota archaeon]HOE52121.1 Gar1/Naf1 family protein [Methanomassiliicoccales archaeon]HOO03651.1 Gar1/Naf1 family protein [Methanomassiliicoccales archaeon]HPD08524.1 Gar1/Naf1 family protein [Methanomassiliicoccales archaeon]HQM67022.1 Gar1/Naf1 family protein [Methanomassiliicoccales archaeon]
MQLLGNVQEVTVDGRLVVRATFTPKLKEAVFDNRKRPLGRIVRIFGPVGSPYVTVEPTGDAGLLSAVGRQVYIGGVENHGKQKGSGR